MAMFEKYRGAVDKMPGAWGKTEEAAGGLAANFVEMTSALMAQAEMLNMNRKAITAEARAEKELEQQRKAAEARHRKANADAEASTHRQFNAVKGMATSALGFTSSLIKWASFGSIFGGLLGAGGLFGIDRLAHVVGADYKQAQGLGVKTGEMQSFGVNFGRLVDPDALLENVANAQSDLSKRWAFNAIGVNPTGKDPAKLSIETLTAAKRAFERGGKTQQYADAVGLTTALGFSMDDLRRLSNTKEGDIARFSKDYGLDAETLKKQEETQKKWQDLSVTLTRSKLEIENVFIKALIPLIDPLAKLSTQFAHTVETLSENGTLKKWLEEFGHGIETVATYLGSAQFQGDMKTFATDVEAVSKAIVKALQWLNIIPDPDKGKGAPPVSSSGGALGRGAVAGATGSFGKLRADQFGAMGKNMAYFMGQGWTEAQAAGLVANLMVESGLDPNAKGDYNKKTGQYEAYGIGQWHKDRQDLFKQVYGKDIHGSSLEEQRAFVQYELTHNEAKAGDALRKAGNNAYLAGAEVSLKYERPKWGLAQMVARGSMAGDLQSSVEKFAPGSLRGGTAQRLTDIETNDKINTLGALIARYDKGGKNVTDEIRQAMSETGLKASDKVDLNNAALLQKLISVLDRKGAPQAASQKTVVEVSNRTGSSAVATVNNAAVAHQ